MLASHTATVCQTSTAAEATPADARLHPSCSLWNGFCNGSSIMPVSEHVTWILGYDGRERTRGALRMIRWLDQRVPLPWSFRAVHVVEHATRGRYEPMSPEEVRSREDTRTLLEHLPAVSPLQSFDFVHGRQVDDALTALLDEGHGHALILGRAGFSGSRSMVKLGRVARKLVRLAPGPLLIVPPDLDPDRLNTGPILIGTDLTKGSVAAARFGDRLAQALDRRAVLVHVAGEEVPGRRTPIPAITDVADKLEASRQQLEAVSDDWVNRHDLQHLDRVTLSEQPASGLLDEAAQSGACMLVIGTRRLPLSERFLLDRSLASELAATAPVPVFIIPGDDG